MPAKRRILHMKLGVLGFASSLQLDDGGWLYNDEIID